MWQKKESKLELAASMIRQVMPEFQEKKQVIKDLKTADSSISLFFIFIPLILFRVNVNSLYPIHVLNAMRIVNSRKLWYNQVIMVSISIQNIKTSVYKGYKQDKIEMRGDRAEMSDFPLYLNTVAGGLDCRDQTIGGFSFVVKIYAVPVIEIIG